MRLIITMKARWSDGCMTAYMECCSRAGRLKYWKVARKAALASWNWPSSESVQDGMWCCSGVGELGAEDEDDHEEEADWPLLRGTCRVGGDCTAGEG